MHEVPKRFLDHPHCLSAWVAGASVNDTPDSNAAYGVVFESPSWPETIEVGERLPREYIWYGDWPHDQRPMTIYDKDLRSKFFWRGDGQEPTKRERYPGTILAAEWLAILAAVRLAARAQPVIHPDALFPFEPPLNPFVLYTTRREIIDVIDGRTPISDTPWLSRSQRAAVFEVNRRIQERSGRDYFVEAPGPGFHTFVSLVRPSENRRALRVAQDVLVRGEARAVLKLDLDRIYDATSVWKRKV